MRLTAKEVSAITREPREVCRTGHCAQTLATAVDPAAAVGGAAAAAAGAAAAAAEKISKVHCT
jgi:hypothetical protein